MKSLTQARLKELLRGLELLSHGNCYWSRLVEARKPICAVVYLAIGCLSFFYAGNIKVEAKVRVSRDLENIDVQNRPVDKEAMRSRIEFGDIFHRENVIFGIHDPLFAGSINGCCSRRKGIEVEWKSVSHGERLNGQIPLWNDATGRSLPVDFVGWSDTDFQRTAHNFNVCNTRAGDMKIGAKLPVFGILHNANLIQRRDEQPASNQGIDSDSNDGANFHSKFPAFAAGIFFLAFLILFGKGYECFVYGGQFLGAVVMGAGWLFGMTAVFMFIAWFLGH